MAAKTALALRTHRGRPFAASSDPEDAATRPANSVRGRMSRERWMALLFLAGSLCFVVGPFPGYLALVGPGADAATFFAGSILFTAGGALQARLAFPERRAGRPGAMAWWSAAVQFA